MELYFKGPAPDFTTQKDSLRQIPIQLLEEAVGAQKENTQLLPSPYPKGRSLGGTPPPNQKGVSLVPRTDFL